jgi:hypothetical protein
MARMNKFDPIAEELAAMELLAQARQARRRSPRVDVPDPYRPAPRRPPAEPLPDLAKAVALMAQADTQEPPAATQINSSAGRDQETGS